MIAGTREGEGDGANAADVLFAGPGEMRALCRAREWAATPLGPVESWPAVWAVNEPLCEAVMRHGESFTFTDQRLVLERHGHSEEGFFTLGYSPVPDDGGFCLKMAEHAAARAGDVVRFGHTHRPWHREVQGLHFVNTGSVGRPQDGDWRAGYVVLDAASDAPAVQVVRVAYDLAEAMEGSRRSELPDDFTEYLASGGQPAALGPNHARRGG